MQICQFLVFYFIYFINIIIIIHLFFTKDNIHCTKKTLQSVEQSGFWGGLAPSTHCNIVKGCPKTLSKILLRQH